jgi:hypothetical protein
LDNLSTHTSLSPIPRVFTPSFGNYKKGRTRLAATSDKVYQLLVHGRWFSPGTPASSTTKTGRHDIAEIFYSVHIFSIFFLSHTYTLIFFFPYIYSQQSTSLLEIKQYIARHYTAHNFFSSRTTLKTSVN